MTTLITLYVKSYPQFRAALGDAEFLTPKHLEKEVAALIGRCHAQVYPAHFRGNKASAVAALPNELGLRRLSELRRFVQQQHNRDAGTPPFEVMNAYLIEHASRSLDAMGLLEPEPGVLFDLPSPEPLLGSYLPVLRSTFILMAQGLMPEVSEIVIMKPRNSYSEPGFILKDREGSELRCESVHHRDRAAMTGTLMGMQACGFCEDDLPRRTLRL